ncbi:unnamed protein product [marine sediment metagenome]|uniref:Uncharacterized protein n=1 Tax=marine sediment metagenome TaxID=412755 RepID=X1SAK2_9ZZZZ
MRKEKKRGPESGLPTGPQRKGQSLKRRLDSKIREVESQETLLMFLFVANCSEILPEPMVKLIWEFMEFLKSNGYLIINEKEVFCVPLSHLVRKKDLK